MKMKKFMVAALAAAITAGSAMSASAAWVESGSDWKYQNTDGSWQTNTWFQDGGKSYHFDANGNVQKGWFKDANGKWFFFSYNGIMQTGLIKVDGKVYFMNDDGSLFVGIKKINNVEYNFTEYGTTNGSPSVGLSQTWGGNGNQTSVVKGGGGWSSSSGSSSSGSNSGSNNSGNTSTPKKAAINAKVVEEVNGVSGAVTAIINEKTGKISLSANKEEGQEDTTLLEVFDEAGDILDGVLSNPDVASVKWGEKEIKSKADLRDFAIAQGFTKETNLEEIKKTYAINVELSNGEFLKYTISIN